VIVNLLMEQKRRRVPRTGWRAQAVVALQTAGTFCLIVVLWSFWNAPTVGTWVELVTFWRVG
jgi:hypothetical protein